MVAPCHWNVLSNRKNLHIMETKDTIVFSVEFKLLLLSQYFISKLNTVIKDL